MKNSAGMYTYYRYKITLHTKGGGTIVMKTKSKYSSPVQVMNNLKDFVDGNYDIIIEPIYEPSTYKVEYSYTISGFDNVSAHSADEAKKAILKNHPTATVFRITEVE